MSVEVYVQEEQTVVYAEGAVVIVPNDGDHLASVVNKECTELVNDKVTLLPGSFQKNNTKLTRVDLPACTTALDMVFSGCASLTSVNLPALETINASSFDNSPNITHLHFPSLVTNAGWGWGWAACRQLKTIIFDKLTDAIQSSDFFGCLRLTTVVLGADVVCPMGAVSAFESTPIAGNTDSTGGELGYVYVRAALVDAYKAATNWSAYADQIRAIENYPEIQALLEV